jgi:hypothetical protein
MPRKAKALETIGAPRNAAPQDLIARERYRYLVETAAERGELWVLSGQHDDEWATYSDPRGHIVIPAWPSRRDAEKLATGKWKDATPTAVALDDFLRELEAMEEEGVQVAAFPTTTRSGAAVAARHFGRALRDAQAGPPAYQ